METDRSITRLLRLAKSDDPEALRVLWDVYFTRLVTVARTKLEGVARPAADEEDVALSVFKSFWRGAREDRFPHLADRNSLWPLLVTITANKCTDLVRRETRQRRGGGLARSGIPLEQVVAQEPTPDFAYEVADQLDHLLTLLDRTGDRTLRRIAVLRMSGRTQAEVAGELGCARETVNRKLVLIEEVWAAEADDEQHE